MTGGAPQAERQPPPKKSSSAAVDYAKKYWWTTAIAVPILVAVIAKWPAGGGKSAGGNTTFNIDRHDVRVNQVNVIQKEYEARNGKPLSDPAVLAQLTAALDAIEQGNASESVPQLQELAKNLDLPSVYTNLGVAYSLAGDLAGASEAYGRAIGLDPANQAARSNQELLQAVRRKAGGNNSFTSAHPIALRTDVSWLLPSGAENYFRFTAPSGPRDWMKLTFKNQSTTLTPNIVVKDPNKATVASTASYEAIDATLEFPTSPGATYYAVVTENAQRSGGPYTLRVEPMGRFDQYEPNDDIDSAKEIREGTPVQANIMDRNDVDYYRFTARSAGDLTAYIEVRGLMPAFSILDEQKNTIKHDAKLEPADISLVIPATSGAKYYVRVGHNAGDGGSYRLTIRRR